MKILVTGSTTGPRRSDFSTAFFQALALLGHEMEDLAVVHRLSRAGMELAAIKAINLWCEHNQSRIAIKNHTPFDVSGGKAARNVMHGEVIQPGAFDFALIFTEYAELDEHTNNVVFWLNKRGIPYHVVMVGAMCNEKVSFASHGLDGSSSGENR